MTSWQYKNAHSALTMQGVVLRSILIRDVSSLVHSKNDLRGRLQKEVR